MTAPPCNELRSSGTAPITITATFQEALYANLTQSVQLTLSVVDPRRGAHRLDEALREARSGAQVWFATVNEPTTLPLFAYGTLLPGEVRWSVLAPYVVDAGVSDTVGGRLFDTGVGYPAALFDGRSTIHGRVFALRADRYCDALTDLDEVEGAVDGAYRRIEVTTATGVRAWAYEYGGGLDLVEIVGGSWMARGR